MEDPIISSLQKCLQYAVLFICWRVEQLNALVRWGGAQHIKHAPGELILAGQAGELSLAGQRFLEIGDGVETAALL
jgi:hypothetical protein